MPKQRELGFRLRIRRLPEGCYLGTSPDVPGLVVEAKSTKEVRTIALGLANVMAEVYLEHGDKLPPGLEQFRPKRTGTKRK